MKKTISKTKPNVSRTETDFIFGIHYLVKLALCRNAGEVFNGHFEEWMNEVESKIFSDFKREHLSIDDCGWFFGEQIRWDTSEFPFTFRLVSKIVAEEYLKVPAKELKKEEKKTREFCENYVNWVLENGGHVNRQAAENKVNELLTGL